jgi:glutamyl-tRNA synthetase
MSIASRPEPVGRLAPSPTGLLHLGHARTFLLAWWHARSRGGRIVMRIEDLDGPRVRSEFSDAALADLEWLGLDWDGAPLVQSSGIERIVAAARLLMERGLAYPCSCTRGDVRAAQSAPQAGDVELRYPGTCRDRYRSLESAERQSGRAPALRFRVPPGAIAIEDRFAGTHSFDVERDAGDFPILRRDGAPAYQLAVVVDDAEQAVTEVVRGDDLLPSAARQWHLQRALGFDHPSFVHVPLVLDETGRRLAKRRDDLSLAELRAGGTDPRAVVTWAARSAGLDVAARASAAEVTPHFSLDRVPREPLVLDARTIDELRSAR